MLVVNYVTEFASNDDEWLIGLLGESFGFTFHEANPGN